MFNLFCTLFGGLGIFYFGLRSLSEVFQAEADPLIRKTLDTLTGNRYTSILTGISISLLVQSSSAVSFSVLGLVNSGLISCTIALSVVLGANIGTTLLGYLLAIPLENLSLLLVGVSFIPTLFSNMHPVRQLSKTLFSLGMIFLGLKMLNSGWISLGALPEVRESLKYFAGDLFLRHLSLVAIGALVSILLQSSVATLGIAITLLTAGLFSFKMGLLLVLGLNLGSTVTPLLSSLNGNIQVKRVALGHFLFHFLWVILLIPFINPLRHYFPYQSLLKTSYDGILLAMAHTLYNSSMAIVLLPFLDAATRFLNRLVPTPRYRQKSLVDHNIMTNDNVDDVLPAMALYQTQRELDQFRKIVHDMFELTDHYLHSHKLSAKEFYQIKDFEKKTDSIQREITKFTGRLILSHLTPDQSLQTQKAMLIAKELETIADYLERIAVYKTRYAHALPENDEALDEIMMLYKEVKSFFNDVVMMDEEKEEISPEPEKEEETEEKEQDEKHEEIFTIKQEPSRKEKIELYAQRAMEIKSQAENIRDTFLEKSKNDEYRPLRDRVCSDITMALSRIRAHIMNMAEGLGRRDFDE